MSFTRFHDDDARIKKSLQESTYAEGYYLNTPGNGVKMDFQMDPQLRLQKWGANLCSNALDVEADFRGLTRKLNKDLITENQYSKKKASSSSYSYRENKPITDESRATHPAWTYRTVEQNRWEHPWINPQDNFERTFAHNIQTRILEKDNFTPVLPQVSTIERVQQ